MKEIAKLANISPTTVSRVFHSPHLVNRETREKIQKITEENNYVYNAVAGNLSSRKSTVIGTLIPNSNRTFFSVTLTAIQNRAREYDYSVISGNTAYDSATEKTHLEQFRRHQISGLILAGYNPENRHIIEAMTKSGIPSVIIWEENENENFSNVGIDNFSAAFTMTEYLIKLGHINIGLISGPSEGSIRVQRRIDGFRDAMAEKRMEIDEKILIEHEPTLSGGAAAMKKLLSSTAPPTAVFAASDTLAIGAMKAARDAGLKIPEDISIAGFDDIDTAEYCCPPLTTIRVPAYEMGLKAVDVLMNNVNNNNSELEHYHLNTKLIIRESCSKSEIN